MNLLKYKDFHDYGLPCEKPANHTDIMKNITYLYNKMQACTRKVTYFDLYKINTVINNSSDFESQISALEPYSTAIVNTRFSTPTDSYSPGDLVIKNIDGTTTTIFAQRGGIFYPQTIVKEYSTIDQNYTYDFVFAFREKAPATDSEEVAEKNNDNKTWNVEYASNLIFKDLSGGAPKSPYNKVVKKPDAGWSTISDAEWSVTSDEIIITLTAAKTEDKSQIYIDPIVHCYANTEEIYMDQNVELETSNEDKDEYVVTLEKTNLCTRVVIK